MINFIIETLCQGNVGMAFLIIFMVLYAICSCIIWFAMVIVKRLSESRKNKLKKMVPKYIRGPF